MSFGEGNGQLDTGPLVQCLNTFGVQEEDGRDGQGGGGGGTEGEDRVRTRRHQAERSQRLLQTYLQVSEQFPM